MDLSAHERRVLDDLEHELALSTGPHRTRPVRRAAPYRSVRWSLAGVGGLVLITLGVVAASVPGIVAALAGYALTVLAASAAVDATAAVRRADG